MIKFCKTVEDGVRNALEIFAIEAGSAWRYIPAKEGDYTDMLELDGVAYPLFWWRCDPQVGAMYAKAPERKICSMKLNRVGAKSQGLIAPQPLIPIQSHFLHIPSTGIANGVQSV